MLNLDKDKKYLLACSFGPDSMALFWILLDNGYQFDVAHVNYHFRKESNLEERNLKEFAKKNNIDIYIYDNKENVDKNLEAKAREMRYNFFSSLCKKNGYYALSYLNIPLGVVHVVNKVAKNLYPKGLRKRL